MPADIFDSVATPDKPQADIFDHVAGQAAARPDFAQNPPPIAGSGVKVEPVSPIPPVADLLPNANVGGRPSYLTGSGAEGGGEQGIKQAGEFYAQQGPGEIIRGAGEMGKGEFGSNLTPEQRTKLRYEGAGRIFKGAGTAMAPLAGPALAAAPIVTTAAIASGAVIGPAAKKLALAAGATPEQADLAEQVGYFAPGTMAAAGGLRGEVLPEGEGVGVSALGDRVAVGAAKNPEGGVTVGGKFGSKVGRVTFGGKAEPTQTGLEPQTIQGEPGAVSGGDIFDHVAAKSPQEAPGRAETPEPSPKPTPQEVATQAKPQAQGEPEPEAILQAGVTQQPELVKTAESIAAQVPGAQVVDPGAKPLESIERKTADGREITDAARAQVVVPNEQAKQDAVQAIAQQTPAHEIEPIKNDNLPIVAAKLPNSQELQVATKDEHDAQAATHDLYAKVQDAKAAGDEGKAGELQKQLDAELAARSSTPPVASRSTTSTKVNSTESASTPGASTETTPKRADSLATSSTAPISSLEKLKEFENLSPRDEERPGDYMEKLGAHIKEKGFKDFQGIPSEEHPVTIGYKPETGKAMILDGHHRMEAAKAAGLKDIPYRIVTGDAPGMLAMGDKGVPLPEEFKGSVQNLAPSTGREQAPKAELKKGGAVTVDGKPGTLTYLSKQPFEKSRVKTADGEVAVPHREVGKRIQAVPEKGTTDLNSGTGANPQQVPAPATGQKFIGVDLDGTLASYDGYKGATEIGAPVPAMVERVKKALADGQQVKIFTARAGDPKSIEAIEKWAKEHIGQALPITNVKSPDMTELWDDRARQVEANTGKIVGEGATNAIQEPRTNEVHERQPEESRTGSGGRVQPSEQGEDGGQAGARVEQSGGEGNARPSGGQEKEVASLKKRLAAVEKKVEKVAAPSAAELKEGIARASEPDRMVLSPVRNFISSESGSANPLLGAPEVVKKVSKIISDVDKAYDRVTDAALQKAGLGRAYPDVERADPQVAADLREMAAGPQYYRAKAERIVHKITDGMTREQEKGFVLLADKDSREWLQANKLGEYQKYITDPRIEKALTDYKPEEEALRAKQKALGGPTIDEDYLRRVYAEHVAGVADDKGEKEPARVNANRVITPQMANKKGRSASPEYYYNNGLHEFGPSFATRYVATNMKLAEHEAAIHFLSKATKIDSKDGLPENITYNGQTYFRPDVARLIKETKAASSESKAIADDLGVDQLPKPKDVREYAVYDPTPADKSDYQAKKLAQKVKEASDNASGTKLRPEDMDELLKQSAAINYSSHPLYVGPKDIVEAFQSGAKHVLPDLVRAVGDAISPASGFVRRQVIGMGLGIPHIKNILRRVMQTSPGAQLDPRSYVRAAKVLFSQELRKRGVSGVDDPAFDTLLRHAGISDRGIEAYRDYVNSNLDADRMARAWNLIKAAGQDWKEYEKNLLAEIKAAHGEGGLRGISKAATTAVSGAVESTTRPLNFVGHRLIFAPGGIDQKARLWLYDFIKSQDPNITDDQMAQRINDQFGRYNKASWTNAQKDAEPFTFFPGWDYSSVAWVLRHPLRTTLPVALLVLLANQVLYHAGKNKRADSTDLAHVHYGNYSITDNLFRERLASAQAGTALRFAQSALLHKNNEQALRDSLAGVPSDARAFVGMLNPLAATPIEVATGKDLGTGRDIVPQGDKGHVGKPEKDWLWYASHKAFPAYTELAAPEKNATPATFALHNIGTSVYKGSKKRRR